MKVELIVAYDANGVIGVNNKLPWHIKEDLKMFKEITMGEAILMGRKTWESIPNKPLPGRFNFVLSRRNVSGCISFGSYPSAIQFLKQYYDKVIVIGGSSLYEFAITQADVLHITQVNEIVRTSFGDKITVFKPDLSRFMSEEIRRFDTHTYTRYVRRFA